MQKMKFFDFGYGKFDISTFFIFFNGVKFRRNKGKDRNVVLSEGRNADSRHELDGFDKSRNQKLNAVKSLDNNNWE